MLPPLASLVKEQILRSDDGGIQLAFPWGKVAKPKVLTDEGIKGFPEGRLPVPAVGNGLDRSAFNGTGLQSLSHSKAVTAPFTQGSLCGGTKAPPYSKLIDTEKPGAHICAPPERFN